MSPQSISLVMVTPYDMVETRIEKPLIFEIVRANIKKMVVAGSLANAAELLAELVEIYDRTKVSEVVLLQYGINYLEKAEREGRLDFEQICKERNCLASRLLKIAGIST